MNNNLHDIYEHDGDKDTLLGLAEECSELSAAALKLVRAIEGKTPKPKDICTQNFLEEFADLECMMVTIANAPWFRVDVVDEIYDAKVERWRKRLEQFDKTGSMVVAKPSCSTCKHSPQLDRERCVVCCEFNNWEPKEEA